MKKFLSLVCVGLLSLTAMTGCSEDSGSGSDGETIRVYTHMGQLVLGEEKKDKDGNTYRDEDTAYLKQLGDRFTKETGINVEFQVVSNEKDIEPLLKVQDDQLDIYTSPNWTTKQFQTYAEPFFTLDECEKDYGEYCKLMPNDGKNVYYVSEGRGYENAIVYNEEALKSVGYDSIPATLKEFNELCEKLKAKGITPMALHRVENWPLDTVKSMTNYIAGESNGFTESLKSDTPFSENEPLGQAIKMITTFKSKGFYEQEVYTDFGVAMDAVAYGKAAMMYSGSWVVPQIKGRVPEGKSADTIKFSAAPDYGNGRYVTGVQTDGYAISKGSKHKEAAKKFINYIAEDADYIQKLGFVANKKGVEPKVPDFFKTIDEQVEKKEATVMLGEARDQNTINMEEVLKDCNLQADSKYAGLLFDSLDITKPNDWSAYDKQVKVQNEAFAKYKKEAGITWIEK